MVDILGTNSVGRERPDNLQVDELTASGRSTWQRASRLAIRRLVFKFKEQFILDKMFLLQMKVSQTSN